MLYRTDTLLPSSLSLPSKFSTFRPAQLEMAEFALYGKLGFQPDAGYTGFGEAGDPRRRFVAIGAPGGIGKTLASAAIGQLSGVKYGVITATRALEDQFLKDGFPLAHVRGKDNYQCLDFNPVRPEKRWSCRDAEGCEEGEETFCRFSHTSGCAYASAALSAKLSPAFLTNYAYWMYARQSNRRALETGAAPIKLLVMDEAHLAVEQLSSFLSCWVGREEMRKYGGREAGELLKRAGRVADEWGNVTPEWAEVLLECAGNAALDLEQAARDKDREKARRVQRFIDAAIRVADGAGDEGGGESKGKNGGRDGDGNGNWVWQLTQNGVQFDCVWPRKYARQYLFQSVPRVVLMSATLRPKAMALLGLARDEYDFKEWPRQFPPHLSPVYWWPTVKLSAQSSHADKMRAVDRLDEIAAAWKQYKGIVHTSSYALAEFFQSHSRFGSRMVVAQKGKGEAVKAAERFRRMPAPAILVSPVHGTGWDFPDADARWQFIPKLPFADKTSPLSVARQSDPDYAMYVTAQELQQQCMRVQRNFSDWGVTIIGDDNIKWFQHAAKNHFTGWFRILQTNQLPKLPRTESQNKG